MNNKPLSVSKRIGKLIKQCLDEGRPVEIDGLGIFRRRKTAGYEFIAHHQVRVFIAYVEEDRVHARRLYDQLRAAGFNAWLDKKKLLPGQNWPRAIREAISVSDFFVACFSTRAMNKRSIFHRELKYALECAAEHPMDEVFLLPLRLDSCSVPGQVSDTLQYVDMFPDWDAGFQRILFSIERELAQRRQKLPRAS